MNENTQEFTRDTVFTLSVAIVLMLLCFSVGLCTLAGAVTGSELLITSAVNVMNLWWLWLIVFAVCLLLPTVKILLVQTKQLKNKEMSIATNGLEMAQVTLMAIIVTFCYILPNIIGLFATANFTIIAIIGLVIPLIWIGMWIATIIIMFVADKKAENTNEVISES